MKICCKLLALCVFHPNVWGTTAFFTQAPKALTFKGHATNPTSSFLGNTNREGVYGSPQVTSTALKNANVSEKALSSGRQVVSADGGRRFRRKPLRVAQRRRVPLGVSELDNADAGDAVQMVEQALREAEMAILESYDESTLQKAASSGVALEKAASSGLQVTNANQTVDMKRAKDIWDTSTPVIVQGGSLRTWATPSVERVQVSLKTEGRPLNANVELWEGPDNTPYKMGIYIEDGSLRPFSAVIETPRDYNAIAIRNTAHLEFPMYACVEADMEDAVGNGSAGLVAVAESVSDMSTARTIQGSSIKTFSFDPSVASVQVLLKTNGRPLNARIELLQGPNNNKQVMEIYTEDGMERPFFAVIETPGSGNVVRIVNTATMEFPLTACVEPYLVEPGTKTLSVSEGGRGWDSGGILDRLR